MVSCSARSTTATRSARRCSTPGCSSCATCREACCGSSRPTNTRPRTCARRPPRARSIRHGCSSPTACRSTAHLDRQRLADLFLDTVPYNAGATASAALWAGVPLVTCRGASLVGRMAASMLHAVGLPELVTANLADYVALAESLARDPARLQSLRRALDTAPAEPAAVRHRALHAASRGGLPHDGGQLGSGVNRRSRSASTPLT